MFVNDFQETVFQTLPGQGWHVLIDQGEQSPQDAADGAPRFLYEPVIAWVTARIPHERNEREEVVIAALVRGAATGELDIVDTRRGVDRVVYLAPGEELTDAHFAQLGQFWRKGVEPRG